MAGIRNPNWGLNISKRSLTTMPSSSKEIWKWASFQLNSPLSFSVYWCQTSGVTGLQDMPKNNLAKHLWWYKPNFYWVWVFLHAKSKSGKTPPKKKTRRQGGFGQNESNFKHIIYYLFSTSLKTCRSNKNKHFSSFFDIFLPSSELTM